MSFAYLASTPGLKYNYSLYAVPAGWVIAMAPLWWAIGKTKAVSPTAYNNAMPKESWKNLKGKLPDDLYGQVIRAVAANDNSHINLPLFAAALVAANAAHVESSSLHLYAVTYLLSRVAYNLAYILATDRQGSYFRSGFYWSGVASCLTLFIKAANRVKSVPW